MKDDKQKLKELKEQFSDDIEETKKFILFRELYSKGHKTIDSWILQLMKDEAQKFCREMLTQELAQKDKQLDLKLELINKDNFFIKTQLDNMKDHRYQISLVQ